MDSVVVSASSTSQQKNLIENDEPLVVGLVGPWGAGKTSILNDLQRRYAPDPERVGIIFAEFGEVNVDAGRIKGRHVVEVKDRCICCHGAEALAEAIQSLRQKVDLILVETSGVSNGGNVRSVFTAMGLRYSILGAVNSAEFAPDDTEILDSQVPSADTIVLTHHYWLGANPSIEDPRLKDLRTYLKETTGRDPDDFASSNFGLRPETFQKVVERAATPLQRTKDELVSDLALAAQTRHHQALLTLVLYDDCDSTSLEAALRESPTRIKRAKGVVKEEDGRMHEFDFVPGRSVSDSDIRAMKFNIQSEDSSSSLFRGRPHAVLCSLNSLGGLSYDQFLSIGLPDLSDAKLDRAFSRYPDHERLVSKGKAFPVYNKEGDRFYGVLSAIRERLNDIPTVAAKDHVAQAWHKTLDAYLAWRTKGLELLAGGAIPGSYEEERNLISLNLLWHLLNCAADIKPELRSRISTLKPATHFFRSCLAISHPPESGQSTDLTQETREMLVQFGRHAIQIEGLDQEVVMSALRHAAAHDNSGTWKAGLLELMERIASEN